MQGKNKSNFDAWKNTADKKKNRLLHRLLPPQEPRRIDLKEQLKVNTSKDQFKAPIFTNLTSNKFYIIALRPKISAIKL